NRSSARTQAAMLEAMQEKQTSIGGEIGPLPQPVVVLATQHPHAEQGTCVLPEAHTDRFLKKEGLTCPAPDEEVAILARGTDGSLSAPIAAQPVTLSDVEFLQQMTAKVYVDPSVKQYIVARINTSRGGGPRPLPNLAQHVRVSASPRGGIALMQI